MTIATETRKVQYAGDGSTSDFPIPFEVLEAAHVRVTYTPASGPSQVLTQGANPGFDVDSGFTGVKNVCPVTASVPTEVGATITVERVVPITQGVDLTNLGTFDAETHEEMFDRSISIDQQLADRITDLEGGTLPATAIGNGLETIAGPTLQVKQHADASINVSAAGVKVGVLATDAQHGNRGGGALHANAVSGGAAGFQSGTDKQRQDALWARTITAGAGLTGGGDLAANRTIDVVAGDGSIVVAADNITVGVISDAQHGARGGGTTHAVATTGEAGFMSAADKAKLDALAAQTISNASVQTADVTVTTLATFTPVDNTTEIVDVLIAARQKSGGGGNSAIYRRTFGVRRFDGTTALVGAVVDGGTQENVMAWDVGVSIASPAVNLVVTGAAATIINWVARIERVSVVQP